MEANGKLQGSNNKCLWPGLANGRLQGSNNKCLWLERLVEAAAAHFRHLRAGKRQARKPQQQRTMEANGRLQGSNNKCLWPEHLVEAAAAYFRHLRAGKRQA